MQSLRVDQVDFGIVRLLGDEEGSDGGRGREEALVVHGLASGQQPLSIFDRVPRLARRCRLFSDHVAAAFARREAFKLQVRPGNRFVRRNRASLQQP
eukprot:763137-Hanusia_phi.AAC.1